MKKFLIIAGLIAAIAGCSDVKRKPGRVYMPDMAYSVAYETYAESKSRLGDSAFYNARPVAGTVKRGEEAYHYEMLTDTTGTYDNSSALKNPLPEMDKPQTVEAERLFLVNCGVCHGPKLDGNGPLYKDGNGPDQYIKNTGINDTGKSYQFIGVIAQYINFVVLAFIKISNNSSCRNHFAVAAIHILIGAYLYGV